MKTKFTSNELTHIEVFKQEVYSFKDAAKAEGLKLNHAQLLQVFANGLGYPTYKDTNQIHRMRFFTDTVESAFSAKNFPSIIQSLFASELFPNAETCQRICLAVLNERSERNKE